MSTEILDESYLPQCWNAFGRSLSAIPVDNDRLCSNRRSLQIDEILSLMGAPDRIQTPLLTNSPISCEHISHVRFFFHSTVSFRAIFNLFI